MRREPGTLLRLDPPFGAGRNLPFAVLDLLVGQALRAHLPPDRPFHRLGGLAMIMKQLRNGFPVNDAVLPQDTCSLERDAEQDVGAVERLAGGLEIGAALEVETLGLGDARQVVGDPLPLERGVLRPGLHPRDDDRRPDPGAPERRLDLRSDIGFAQPRQLIPVDVRLGIDPAVRRPFGQRHRPEPERLHIVQAAPGSRSGSARSAAARFPASRRSSPGPARPGRSSGFASLRTSGPRPCRHPPSVPSLPPLARS